MAASEISSHVRVVSVNRNQKSRRLVNASKIIRIVRAKLYNSELADEFMKYLLFVTIYIAILYAQRNGQQSQSMYQAIRGQFVDQGYVDPKGMFKTFFDIVTPDDMWNWLETFFLPRVYQESYYRGPWGPRMAPADKYTILMHNKLTGGFRMLQRRRKAFDCLSSDTMGEFTGQCYSDVGLWNADRSPFQGIGNTTYTFTVLPGWQGGAFVEAVPLGLAAARERLAALRKDGWVNRGTASLGVGFVLYNGNLASLLVVDMTATFSAAGQVRTNFQASSVSAQLYGDGVLDQLRQAGELAVAAGWLAYAVAFVFEAADAAAHRGLAAFAADGGRVIKAVQLALFAAAIGLWIRIVIDPVRNDLQVTESAVTAGDGGPVDLTGLVTVQQAYFTLNGVNVLLCVVRVMNFLRVNYTLSRITDTLAFSMGPLLQFVVVLLAVLFAFVLMGHLLFGQDLECFSTFNTALQTGYDTMTGSGNFWELYGSNPVAAWLWYLPFVLIMMLVVLNVVVSVIMDGYERVDDHRNTMRERELGELVDMNFGVQIYRGFRRRLWFLRRLFTVPSQSGYVPKKVVLQLLAGFEESERVPFSDIRYKLGDRNVTEETLESVVDRYGGWVTEEAGAKGKGDEGHDGKDGKDDHGHEEEHVRLVMGELKGVEAKLLELTRLQELLQGQADVLVSFLHDDSIYVTGTDEAPPEVAPPSRPASVSDVRRRSASIASPTSAASPRSSTSRRISSTRRPTPSMSPDR